MQTTASRQLEQWLCGTKKVVVLCIGSRIRSDDSLGLALADELKGKVPAHVTIIDGGTVPENYTGTIRRIMPSHVLMIDATEMGLATGQSRFVEAEKINGFALSTHAPSLSVVARYLSETTGAKVALIAIQPKSLEFGEALTEDLRRVVRTIGHELIGLLEKHY